VFASENDCLDAVRELWHRQVMSHSSLEDDNEEQHVSLHCVGIHFVYFLESSILSLRVHFQKTSVNDEVIQNYISLSYAQILIVQSLYWLGPLFYLKER
jgi:hypothetical protein